MELTKMLPERKQKLKSLLRITLYIALPLYLCIYLLTKYIFIYFPYTYTPIFKYVYLPSILLLMLESGNPHYANPVLEVVIPFIQTFIMVFAVVLVVHKFRTRGNSGKTEQER